MIYINEQPERKMTSNKKEIKMIWCKKCVENNLRPTSIFDNECVCLPCRYFENITEINWAERAEILEEIVAWAKLHNVSGYDCIIGVSGGKDSIRQALFAREIGMKPLLVSCSNPPEHITERGPRNLANLINLGFDTITVSPAPGIWKELMRHSFIKFGNYCKATELALFSCVPRVAICYQIPLILLGENPGLAWGTDVGSNDFNGNKMKYMNTLQGGNPRPLMPDWMSNNEVFWYKYPTDEEMLRANLRIVYIGYFIKDFNDHTNSKIAIENGLEIREGADADPVDTGSIYPYYALEDDFVYVNQMIKHMKFGIGQAAEQISGAIRNGIMTREVGKELLKKYDGKCADRFINKFADYLEISVDEFWDIAEKYRNKDIWEKDENNKWKLNNPIE